VKSGSGANSNLNSTTELPDAVDVGNQSIAVTPRQSLSTSLTYVSPFVTLGRVVRKNRAAGEYFRFQVNNETEKLKQKIEEWDKYRNKNDHIDSVYLDQIAVAIGQTNLLLTKKFQQFLALISQCEEGTSKPPVLPEDLEGFWSMVYMQVENCNDRFNKLVTLRENNWMEVDLLPPVVAKQTKSRKAGKNGATASAGIQKMIEEARIKMKENRITDKETSSSAPNHIHGMTLRQTPARLSLTNATPKSIIKSKIAGQRSTKSVAFAFAESPTPSLRKSKTKGTPKPKTILRRASTSGIPIEKGSNASEI
ncbi:Guanylate kinase-associated protein mars, partial [Pseudolycoriella hygida]